MTAALRVRGWFKVFASPAAHIFPEGIFENARALCGVIATRPRPWSFAPPTAERCSSCVEGARS